MVAKTYTFGVVGIEAFLVEVEVDISTGLPSFSMVGLPDNIVRESRERVKSALHNCGYPFPMDRITVNLAPAHIKKEGAGFDLPVAVGLLAASGLLELDPERLPVLVGELSLDGRVKAVNGCLPMAMGAKALGWREMIVPSENVAEAAVVGDLTVHGADHLARVVEHLGGGAPLPPHVPSKADLTGDPPEAALDLRDIKGQEHAKRALEVAAAGNHNILLVGPPGSGKSMLAQRLPSILPPLSLEESLETSQIYSVAGLLGDRPLVRVRPFRHPHHTISDAGLIGGGHVPRPGEVSLAHNGVLFLDELPEFRRNILDLLRQPMEDGRVTIARASMTLTYPARFMLAAAMNPCPCGYAGEPRRACRCSAHQIQRYRSRISGPILDRIDLHVEVPAVEVEDLRDGARGEASSVVRERVCAARRLQQERFAATGIFANAFMGPRQLERFCELDSRGERLLDEAFGKLHLSARAYHRILKVARTIADLESSPSIEAHHLLEAIQYRSLDRDLLA
ncbi:magnesium chelatase family protein [Desulfacinum hydrothermale DSM 13146]|uniref:Magnesium chelatase family protein n=1 Tax=Desulfacinum hydrothermale DSM 13146 TaxID=1121390 RepID=A0A1W1XIP4_9BACT|nr:YifB family Mg chelatase-like AAA ATPase [Desulfacinum hydrothermale]SMC23697.1 magnesium chelatase family protein [Desulfacinum hydrothermale DSM 13146]